MANDNYATPNWIMVMFDGWFDPCPLNSNPNVDGLSLSWQDKTYVNPPYSDPLPWVRKAIEENKQGKTIALLLKMDVSTKYYRELVSSGAHFFHITERVKFNGTAPSFCNMLVILERQ